MKEEKVAPENQADHEIGLEIIRVLNLRRKRENGRVDTTHGDKTPCGLARTLRDLARPTDWKTQVGEAREAIRKVARNRSVSTDTAFAALEDLGDLIAEILDESTEEESRATA